MIEKGMILNDTYEIIERMGSGGGGIIYKAYHRRMEKYVAIKLIKDEIKGALNNRAEVDVLKNLKNDYLPQVLDFVEEGNDVYTVMEFIEGENFRQLIESGRTFDEKQVRKYALQLCSAVTYLHGQTPPVIHSDIKPANIMLTPKDNICLIDFNISAIASNGTAGAIGGSNGFAAPEQFKRIINAPAETGSFHEETRFIDNDMTEIILDENNSSDAKTKDTVRAFIDVRTDIYGMGASLYYLLTERIPNNGKIDFRGVKISSKMQEIIRKAMNPIPSKRYRNVEEMKNDIIIAGTKNMNKAVPPFVVALLVFVIGIAAIMLNGRKIDTEDISFSKDLVISEELTETVTEPSLQTTVISSENSDTDKFNQITESDVISVYNNGNIECEKTAVLENGDYELTYYMENGLIDYSLGFHSDGQIYNVKLYDSLTGALIFDSTPELTDNGYTFEMPSDKYVYVKRFIIDNKLLRKKAYCNEDGEILLWDIYTYEFNEDGSWKSIHRDENSILKYTVEYYTDDSKLLTYYNADGSVNRTVFTDPNGASTTYAESTDESITSESLIKEEEMVSELISLEDTKAITEFNETDNIDVKKTTDELQKEYITIKGQKISVLTEELILSNMDLFDSDIKELEYLTQLKKLELNGNNITNIEPISELTNLEELKLSYNDISDFTPLIKLKKLQVLKIGGNKDIDLSFISSLTNLRVFKGGDSNICDISALESLSQLELLDLRANNISDVSALSKLPALSEVYLYKNPINNLMTIKNQNNLNRLWLDSSQLDQISYLSQYKNCNIMILEAEDDVLDTVRSELPDCDVKSFSDPWAEIYGY